jgi:hypothetical protein
LKKQGKAPWTKMQLVRSFHGGNVLAFHGGHQDFGVGAPFPHEPVRGRERRRALTAPQARLGSAEEAMLNVLLSLGSWALVCVLIFFAAEWVEREREFFGREDVKWGRLE